MVFAKNIFVMKPEKYIFTLRQKLLEIQFPWAKYKPSSFGDSPIKSGGTVSW